MGYEETLAAFRRGDNAEAERLARDDLARATEGGDTQARVDALCMLARTALREGRLDDVEANAREAFEVAGDQPRLQRMPIHLRAVAARLDGRLDEARSLYRESIRLNEALGEAVMAAAEHRNLAYVEIRAGRPADALKLFGEARRRLAGQDAQTLVPYLTLDEASAALLHDDPTTARTRLAEAESQFAAQGVVPDPDDAGEIDRLRHILGP